MKWRILFALMFMGSMAECQNEKSISITYLGKPYTLKSQKPVSGHTDLKLCDAGFNCPNTDRLVYPVNKTTFTTTFRKRFKEFDSTYTKTSSGELNQVIDGLYEWINKQWQEEKQNEEKSDALDVIAHSINSKEAKTRIGVLCLNTKAPIMVFNARGNPVTSSSVKEIRLTLEGGVIERRSLFVLLEDGNVYFNRYAPVSFPVFFKRRSEKLTGWNTSNGDYIVLGDAIDYFPFGKIYYPADEEIKLTADKPCDTLDISATLNNMIDLSVYTDLLGVLGDKANGLIQTEVAGNFISNTGNFKNANITVHSFMRPYIRLSRFDSKFRSLDTNNVRRKSNGDSLNRTYLNQISYLQAGLKGNFARFGLGANQYLQVNIGADINLVNADSLYKRDITFFNYYSELGYVITRLKNFGMEANLRFMRQRISEGNRDIVLLNREGQTVLNESVNIYWYPSEDPASRIYFRFSYYDNFNDSKYNFSQFQVGYKTNLKIK